MTRQEANQRWQNLQKRLPDFKKAIEGLRSRKIDPAYPLASYTTLEDFVNYVAEDLRKGQTQRAPEALEDLEGIANRLQSTLDEAQAGKLTLPTVPRYVTSKIEIKGPSFIADTVDPITGKRTRSPVFFVGFGHFGQVRQDIEKFPRYGFNIIQIEMGPSDVFPAEGKVSTDKLTKDILPVLKRAAKANVAVNLLLSPHYFPAWMLQKYPHLKRRRQGFLQYSLYAPEGQELLKQYIATIMPLLKGQPALHSLCLSNEPINVEDPNSPLLWKAWHAWLQQRHKSLPNLNHRWNTQYKDWKEIAVPIPQEPIRYMEWCLFNQEWFAGWHRMLADEIRKVDPQIPLHAKLMTWNFFSETEQKFGIDPDLFADFCEIHGNDAATFYEHQPDSEWANHWLTTLMGHDLQRSLKDAPIFNSENHLIPDRETKRVPPVHVRNALWQEAVYGLSATTFWVWERTDDPKSDFAGSMLHRPACVEALAHTALDLQRLAPYVQALQQKSPDVYILHSPAALVRGGNTIIMPLQSLYIALTMLGFKVGFITERQLEAGKLPPLRVPICVPNIHHLSDEAFLPLQQFQSSGGRIFGVGKGLLDLDYYNRARASKLSMETIRATIGVPAQVLMGDVLRAFTRLNLPRPLQLKTPEGSIVWGVAYRTAPYNKGFVANLCNYTQKPITVRPLTPEGKAIQGKNLFTEKPLSAEITLTPLEPLLIYWEGV